MIAFLFAAAVAIAPPAAAKPPASVAPAPAASDCPQAQSPDALVCRALNAQSSGDNQNAAQLFEQAARAASDSDPKTSRLLAAAGNLWIAAGQPGKAAFDLDRALILPGLEGDQRGEAQLDRARAAEAQNDLKTARARWNDARLAIPEDPFLWYFSAALAIRENDLAMAQSSIGEALKRAPTDPTILFEAGHVAEFAGDEARARTYWEQSAASDPTGAVGQAAREAIKMLPAPAKVPPKVQPKS
jgi:tetratricopeptide (TPR) repeat protein